MKKITILLITLIISLSLYSKERIVAISYFDNTSGIKKYDPLTKGIVDMLITDLSGVKTIRLVEREKLEQLLKEIKLGKSKYFDNKTAQKLGKGLGAEVILTGSFFILNRDLRIDARLIEVETGQILLAKKVTGNKNDFFDLHEKLAKLLIKGMKVDNNLYRSKYKRTEIDFNAVVDYSKALNLKDQGKNNEAKTILRETLQEYPKFVPAKVLLKDAEQWLKKHKTKRIISIKEKLDRMIKEFDINDDDVYNKIEEIIKIYRQDFEMSKMILFIKKIKGSGLDRVAS